MPRKFLRDCQAGDLVEDVFAMTNKQLGVGTNGKHYIKAFVGDRTMTMNARIWNASREVADQLPDGGFVRLLVRIENYQSNLQAIIERWWPAKPGSFDVADLVPCTTKDVPTMFGKITSLLRSIRNRHLKAIVDAYLADEKLMNDFRRAPAAMNFHHAFLGGLLEHTLNAVEVADAACAFYPAINRDVVVAGIFLHDIAKTWELTYETAFGYTDGGQLIGHIVKAAMWVDEKRKAAEAKLGEPIPQPLVDVLQHIILSHHGEMQYGSPKTPATPEAIMVHQLENMDAKLTVARGACRGEGDGTWTEYMKMFEGRMYRPDVAPGGVAEPTVMSITNPLFEAMPARRR